MSRVVLQDLSDGRTRLVDAPDPTPAPAHVVVATRASVVSAGTERMLVDFGRASLLGKARSQPQRVGEVIDKARTDGIATTVDAVRAKLAQPIPLGYSSAGVVVSVGRDVEGLSVGDLVAGAGPHAEMASIPANLVAPVPAGVDAADAAFATIGSIGLQGVRLAAPTLGERVVVTGLGLVGLVVVQLLHAHGCRVLGIDPNPDRRRRAEALGADTADPAGDVVAAAQAFSAGRGVDAVVICASTTSNEPVAQAAAMCRKRGRIVLVGVTGLELDRAAFYEKELSFQVSAAYGPGRYDPVYEDGGVDYPFGLVRWTAGRNIEAVLDQMAAGRLDVASLVTHRHPLDDAPAAYDVLVGDPTSLGIVLEYPERDTVVGDRATVAPTRRPVGGSPSSGSRAGDGRVGVIGAGSYASQVLLPALRDAGAVLDTIVARRGTTAAVAAESFGAARAASEDSAVLDEPSIDTVVVATRHDSHAGYVERALRSGKHVFVEKPLAITDEQLAEVRTCLEELAAEGAAVPLLGIGFNRRFAPVTRRMRELLDGHDGPVAATLTMNAGAIPADHWTQDPAVGGGRLIGEACHLVDLARHLVGSPIVDVSTTVMGGPGPADTASATLSFADGSLATVNYFANGSKRYPKERVEVFAGGRVLVNDNFRVMRAHGWPGARTLRLRRVDKGHVAGVAAFLDAVRTGGPAPIPVEEILEVSEIALRIGRGG